MSVHRVVLARVKVVSQISTTNTSTPHVTKLPALQRSANLSFPMFLKGVTVEIIMLGKKLTEYDVSVTDDNKIACYIVGERFKVRFMLA